AAHGARPALSGAGRPAGGGPQGTGRAAQNGRRVETTLSQLLKCRRASPDRSADDFRQRPGELIDVLRRAERPGADADRPGGERADGPVDVRGAVLARPDGNVERRVEDAAERRRVQRL